MTLKLPTEDLSSKRAIEKIRITMAEQTRMAESITAGLEQLSEQLKDNRIKQKKIDEKYLAIMLKADWPPVIDRNYEHVLSVVNKYKKEDFDTFKRELDLRLLEYFDKNVIEEKLSEWRGNERLKGRILFLI